MIETGCSVLERPCVLIGAGGHAKVLADCLRLRNFSILGCVVKDAAPHSKIPKDLTVLGQEEVLAGYATDSIVLVNGIGSTRNLADRARVFEVLGHRGYRFLTVTHPSAILGAEVLLGQGVQVMAGAVVQAGVTIGENTIINTGALIDHDCAIGTHVHISPGCVLSGNVRVGPFTHIGTGARVIQGISVGARCLVAAGAVVIRNVPDDTVVMGVPAKERRS